MQRRRLAAGIVATLTAALLLLPGVAAGGVATGAGGTAPSSPGGRGFALTLLTSCGVVAVTGFVVQRRRSSS